MKKIITIFFILLSFSAYSINIDELTKKADSGDVDAQLELGWIYNKSKDYSKSFKYFKLAANKGSVEAHWSLGFLYADEESITKDYTESIKYFSLCLNKDYAQCLYQLGEMYKNGEGVKQDFEIAINLYNYSCYPECDANKIISSYENVDELIKKANNGDVNAQYNLGFLYLVRVGIILNSIYIDSVIESAGIKDANAQIYLKNIYQPTVSISILKNNIMAIKYSTLAANQGHAKAIYILGSIYDNEEMGFKDYKKAFEYYKLASEKGNSFAQCKLAIMYKNGVGTQKNLTLAKKWYKEVYDNDVGLFKDRCYEYQQMTL